MSRGVIALLLVAAIFCGLACRPGGGGTPAPKQVLKTESALSPGALYSPKAELVYAGTALSVDVKRIASAMKVRFDFIKIGSVLDSEVYRSSDKDFGLIEMNMESYNPPIPLLKFPMNVGDKWEWKGNQESGGLHHKSWAKITTSIDKLPEHPEVVKVVVDLFVDSNAGKPSERNLEFWFVKGRGLAKRTYGDAITRISLEPGEVNGGQ